ncbi:MAG: hypothetical protein R8M11_08080 [Gallionella sp.]
MKRRKIREISDGRKDRFFTLDGIVYRNAGTASDALISSMRTKVANGEAVGYVVKQADNAAGSIVVETIGNTADSWQIIEQAYLSNINGVTRDSLAVIFGTLAGLAALPTGKAKALIVGEVSAEQKQNIGVKNKTSRSCNHTFLHKYSFERDGIKFNGAGGMWQCKTSMFLTHL